MLLSAIKENDNNETRVSISPESVKLFSRLGFEVIIENGAGETSGYQNSNYEEAGAKIVTRSECLKADVCLCVRMPSTDDINNLKSNSLLIGILNPYENKSEFSNLNKNKISSCCMELIPRISRAQSMDVLSSQANLAGYRSVIDAAEQFGKAFPMMMTAAGTVAAAKVLIVGAGVAGLQAIATAKRMGAIVFATDVRMASKEQVESLGGKFLTVEGAENLEKTLESIKEKDLKITRIQDALNRKDSVTFALVTSLKKEIGINDPDIEVNVDKAVVFISLSDKLLFKSGSYQVSERAKEILGKVATVVNGKPDFECMVEGHTDNLTYKAGGVLLDNWDLSVKRATSIVRVLKDLDVNPSRLIAAGRSYFDPLVDNDTAENRSINRRTRIIIMPKIDQFYDMIEKEMQSFSN